MTTEQKPIHSGYGARTTAREVIGGSRFDGAIAVVTGGYTGVGLETTRAIAAAGATVIVPARTPDKARAALAGMERVELERLDLADPTSIDAFAARFSVRRAHGARVVSLSSRGHMRASIDLDDPHFERRPYDKWIAYGQAKTANALFALALDARGAADRVRAFSVHPGAVFTELVRHMSDDELRALRPANAAETYKTPGQGAATSVWCATSGQLEGRGGVYCEDVDIAEAVTADFPEPRGVRPWAMNRELAERLWTKSEEWVGLTFPA